MVEIQVLANVKLRSAVTDIHGDNSLKRTRELHADRSSPGFSDEPASFVSLVVPTLSLERRMKEPYQTS